MADVTVPLRDSRATPPRADWQPMAGSPGWSEQLLLQTSGYATKLMRVEAGTVSEPHAHDRTEQVYILEGSLYDADGTVHRAGTFIIRAAGAVHGGGSHDGATMLVFYGELE